MSENDRARAGDAGSTWSIVVYSHLRWNFVYQRPQHVLSRLARHGGIFFVEEPIRSAGSPRIEVTFPTPNLIRCVPTGDFEEPPFGASQVDAIAPLLRRILQNLRAGRHVAWLYTPMALPLATRLEPEAIVYDCMDELTGFAGAPAGLAAREAELFAVADLVFTGGQSLYRAKREHHPAVHCFPSSVEVDHFRRAGSRPGGRPPRLGFYGVLDERLDRDLVAAVAAARPDWHFDVVGPVAKIDPSTLPRAANIHYPGPRDYAALPDVIAEWDVCLMPFALNAATRFISPTKVLEYMAAERPIVSTPITDVAEPYGDVVWIARDADQFTSACEAALGESAPEWEGRKSRMREIVAGTSWGRTVGDMHGLIRAVMQRKTKGESSWNDDTTRSSSAPAPRG